MYMTANTVWRLYIYPSDRPWSLNSDILQGEVLYRVRWRNYSSDDDTWEPEAHLDDCREVLLVYKKVLAEMKPKKETGMVRLFRCVFT